MTRTIKSFATGTRAGTIIAGLAGSALLTLVAFAELNTI